MNPSTVASSTTVQHTSIKKTGVLLVNLGTPDSPSVPDVRRYLRQFLMDGRVIDIPAIPRYLLVNGIIAPFRAPKSAKIYKEVWTDQGSPLKVYGLAIEKLIQQALPSAHYEVRLAMRYQNPSIDVAMADFKKMGLSKIVVLPFFPQYASASTGSVYEKVMRLLTTWQVIPEVRFINNFYDHPKFIEGFVNLGKKYMAERSYDHYMFSYHGLPQRQIRKGDENKNVCVFGECCGSIQLHNQHCYRAQCFATTRLLVSQLGLKEGQYTTCFQSRLGNDPWIKPYTDEVIKELTKKGIKSVLAFSPSFVSDCLETTIEIGEEYKEIFEENGGQHWQLVESLNDSPIWVETILDLIQNN